MVSIQHHARAKLTTETGRYSTVMVAKLLGVPYTLVGDWIANGWLKARIRVSSGMSYAVIEESSVRLFLRTHGAMRPSIQPSDEDWKQIVERSRAMFLHQHISSEAIAGMLGIGRRHISYLKKYMGFPNSAYYFHTRGGGAYFANRDIISWLRTHTQYDQNGSIRRKLNHICMRCPDDEST